MSRPELDLAQFTDDARPDVDETKYLVSADTPLQLYKQCPMWGEGDNLRASLAPPVGEFHVRAVRVFNGAFEACIESIEHEGLPLIPGETDAAAFNREPFVRAPWGTLTPDAPLDVVFSSVGSPSCPPFINLVIYGYWVREREGLLRLVSDRRRVVAKSPDPEPVVLPPVRHPWGIPRE